MDCLACGKLTDQKCDVCNIPYCNKECQEADQRNHRVFCYPQLHKRIKSCVDHAIDNFDDDRGWCLSAGYIWLVPGVKITPFGKFGTLYCVICAKDLGPYGYKYVTRTIQYRGSEHDYVVCYDCNRMRKQLCPVTLAEPKLCLMHYGLPTFLACLKWCEIRVSKDIKRLICQAVDSCGHI